MLYPGGSSKIQDGVIGIVHLGFDENIAYSPTENSICLIRTADPALLCRVIQT
jgi:hypothetical protein